MSDFILDLRLEKDTVLICDLTLSQLRLSCNAAFPWVMLIPRRANIVEIIDLNDTDRATLWDEILFISSGMKKIFAPKKLNVANLGNIVPQLHVHVIARFEDDKAWPGPIWNSGVKADYEDQDLEKTITRLKQEFLND